MHGIYVWVKDVKQPLHPSVRVPHNGVTQEILGIVLIIVFRYEGRES